jgi:hypothetical protein
VPVPALKFPQALLVRPGVRRLSRSRQLRQTRIGARRCAPIRVFGADQLTFTLTFALAARPAAFDATTAKEKREVSFFGTL